jgi:hypothetical protein
VAKHSVAYRVARAVTVAASLLALYVFSVGPVVWLTIKIGAGGKIAEFVYAPLRPMIREGNALDSYVRWWADIAVFGTPDTGAEFPRDSVTPGAEERQTVVKEQ